MLISLRPHGLTNSNDRNMHLIEYKNPLQTFLVSICLVITFVNHECYVQIMYRAVTNDRIFGTRSLHSN